MTLDEKIVNALKTAGKPLKPGEIAEIIGVDSKAVSQAIAALKKSGRIVSPKRCYYAPAE